MGSQGMQGHVTAGPAIIDANGDGVIGDDEAAAIEEALFLDLDMNGDGRLNLAEFGAFAQEQGGMKAATQRFDAIDADKDGAVAKGEFMVDAHKRYRALDTDGDGKVTPWEYRAGN